MMPAAAVAGGDAARRGWWVVAGGVAAALHAGKLAAALPALEADLGLRLVQGAWLLSLFQIASLAGAMPVSLAAGRLGLRRAFAGGLVLLSLGSLCGAGAGSLSAIAATRVLESLGLLLVVVSGPTLLRAGTQGVRQPFMLAAWGMFMPGGIALGMLAAPTALAHGGWPALWLGCAFASLLCAACVLWRGPRAAEASTPWRAGLGQMRRVLATPRTSRHGAMFAVYAGSWLAMVGLLPRMLAGHGIAPGAAALLAAGVVAGNVAGNYAAAVLALRRVPARLALLTGYAALGLALPLALFESGQPAWLRVLAAGLGSTGAGLVPATLFRLLPEVAPDAAALPATTGWMLQCSALGQLLLPPLLAAWGGYA